MRIAPYENSLPGQLEHNLSPGFKKTAGWAVFFKFYFFVSL
jgi:hypothetical protein